MDALVENTYQIASSYPFVTGTATKATCSLAFELVAAVELAVDDETGVETDYYRCDVCLN